MSKIQSLTLMLAMTATAARAHAIPPDPVEPPPPSNCKPTIRRCSTKPAYVAGAARGDLVFHQASGDGIGAIMRVMGLNLTHMGMMLSESTVRHNTVSKEYIMQQLKSDPDGPWGVGDACIFGGADTGDAWIDPPALSRGLPGLHSADLVNELTYLGGGRYWTGAITLIKGLSDGTSQDKVRSAASALEQLQQGYDFYGFTNLADSVARGGAMCSGSVLTAWQRSDSEAGGFRWNGAATKFYSGAYRAPRATYIYDLLYETAYPEAYKRQDCSAGAITTGIAKQFVNGFASGPYTQSGVPYKDLFTGLACYAWTPVDPANGTFEWERTTCWNANSYPAPVGDGNTASPDDLMERIQAGATSYSAVGTTPTLVSAVTTCVELPNPKYPACLG